MMSHAHTLADQNNSSFSICVAKENCRKQNQGKNRFFVVFVAQRTIESHSESTEFSRTTGVDFHILEFILIPPQTKEHNVPHENR